MGQLAYTVYVKDPKTNEDVAYGPDSDDIPGWALKQMGDHCFEDGQKTDSDDEPDGQVAYSKQNVPDLEAEIERRNNDRADDDQIVVGGKGNKADLVAALEADDAAHAE